MSDVVVAAEDAVAGGRAGSDRDNMVRKLLVGPLVAASGTRQQPLSLSMTVQP